jgi:hypothetical protein
MAIRVSPSFLRVILATGLLLALGACTSGPPELLSVEWTLQNRPIASGSYESLSVFANIKDPDGLEDIETLWILCDGSESYWTLDVATWTKRVSGADTWIGAADLALPDRSSLPRTGYRVIVADQAGNRAESSFRLESATPTRKLPRLVAAGSGFTLESAWPENYLLAYDQAGALIRSAVAKVGQGNLEVLFGTNDFRRAVAVAAYGCDSGLRLGAFSPRSRTR